MNKVKLESFDVNVVRPRVKFLTLDEMTKDFFKDTCTKEPRCQYCLVCEGIFDEIINKGEVKKMKIKCKVCGYEFEPTKEMRYISREERKTGLVAFSGEEAKLYDTFDCTQCGCQIVVQKRNRIFEEYTIEDKKQNEDNKCEQESSVAMITTL